MLRTFAHQEYTNAQRAIDWRSTDTTMRARYSCRPYMAAAGKPGEIENRIPDAHFHAILHIVIIKKNRYICHQDFWTLYTRLQSTATNTRSHISVTVDMQNTPHIRGTLSHLMLVQPTLRERECILHMTVHMYSLPDCVVRPRISYMFAWCCSCSV